MTLVKIPGESPATFAARVRRTEIAVGNPDPGPSIAELLLSVRAGTQSRSLNPCGQVAGGLFGPGNTCAAGDGSGGTPAPTPSSDNPLGITDEEIRNAWDALDRIPQDKLPSDMVRAGQTWDAVRAENIKHFDRIRKRVEKVYTAAGAEWVSKLGVRADAQSTHDEVLQHAFNLEGQEVYAYDRAQADPKNDAKWAEVRRIGGELKNARLAIEPAEKELADAKKEVDKADAKRKGVITKVLGEEVGRVLREDGREDIGEHWSKWLKENRLHDVRFGGRSDKSRANFEGSENAKSVLAQSDAFLQSVAHPEIHRKALGGSIAYDAETTRESAGLTADHQQLDAILGALDLEGFERQHGKKAQVALQAEAFKRVRDSVGTINASPNTSFETMIHEVGHEIEAGNVEASDLAHSFRNWRIKRSGTPDVKLTEEFPDYNFKDYEIANVDDFAKAVAAVYGLSGSFKDHRSYYCGKKYENRVTEVTSMGVNLMERDPVALAKADPDYFDFVVGVLTGRALTKTRAARKEGR